MKFTNILFAALASITLLSACEKKEDPKNTLTVTKDNFEFPAEGGTETFVLNTNASSWEIENPASDWLTVSTTSGEQKEALISLKVTAKTLVALKDTLILRAGTATPLNIIVSQASSEYLYDLKSNKTGIFFKNASATSKIEITSTSAEWTLTPEDDWVTLSQTSGAEGNFTVDISVSNNPDTEERNSTVTLSAEGAPTTVISVNQEPGFPSYNTDPIAPDTVGMGSTAGQLAAKMKVGWNIGNTMESTGGETAWGNPLINEGLIDLVKQSGFNAVRIPCAWNQHMANSSTAEIKKEWLDRVKEVVSYCVDRDMYVLLNIHWDGGWLEENCTPAARAANNLKQKAFWEQIATHMRDFDEHLMFASANEPNVDNSTEMAVLSSYHQTFVDAVRSTGGKNSYRVLVVQGPSTDIETTYDLMNTLPTDEVSNKMMIEVHYYSPYQFCLMTENANWSNMFYYWGDGYHSTTDTDYNATWGEETELDAHMNLMKNKFVIKGIPVILGEYGAMRRSDLTGDDLELHLASRAYYLKYVTNSARSRGLIPFYWDTGYIGNNTFTLFDRNNNTVYDKVALDSIIAGAEAGF